MVDVGELQVSVLRFGCNESVYELVCLGLGCCAFF